MYSLCFYVAILLLHSKIDYEHNMNQSEPDMQYIFNFYKKIQ